MILARTGRDSEQIRFPVPLFHPVREHARSAGYRCKCYTETWPGARRAVMLRFAIPRRLE